MANFQTQVNTVPAPAVAGDFATTNPRYSLPAGPGGLVAGASGVTVGLFAWLSSSTVDTDGAPALVNNTGSGVPAGIVPREQQALITTYLQEAGNLVPAGFPVSVLSGADLWVKNAGASAVTVGMVAFAKTADGTASFAAAGATVSGSVETAWVARSAGAAGELIKISRLP
ncbi:hypothetical protein V5F38_05130 [Xanthobacter sp. V0B-10]|uniref:structural cement protein Gp24 n=1 Tax=Xanthobacter albus TaxID=3119929 RepID=UPI003726D858